jgi:hypothetical protein
LLFLLCSAFEVNLDKNREKGFQVDEMIKLRVGISKGLEGKTDRTAPMAL